MARLGDIAPILRKCGAWGFIKRVIAEIQEDNLFVWACALAYSWLFAIFPFLIFVLALAPYAPHKFTTHVEGPLFSAIDELPPAAASVLHSNVDSIIHERHTGLLSIGILVTIWAASSGTYMTLSAMDQIYDLRQERPYYRQRLLAIGLTLAIAIMILLVLLLMPIGDAVTRHLERAEIVQLSRGVWWAWTIARYVLALVLILTVLATFYYFGPAVKQPFQPVTPGAVFTIICWMIVAVLFRVYVEHFGKFNQTYGTVGGVAILLLFFYIDAVVLLIGGEINSELDFARGIVRGSTDFRSRRAGNAHTPSAK